MTILTEKQQQELNESLYFYLKDSLGLQNLAEQFKQQLELEPQQQQPYMMEKRWSSLMRLQRRIIELEQNPQKKPKISQLPSKVSKEFRISTAVTSVAYNGDRVVVGGDDGFIRVFEQDEEFLLKGHTRGIQALKFHEQLIISGSSDQQIKIWELQDKWTCMRTLSGHSHAVTCLTLYDNKLYSGARDGQIKVWDIAQGYCTSSYDVGVWIRSIAAGTSIVCGLEDHRIAVLNSTADYLMGHQHVVESVTFLPSAANTLVKELTGQPQEGQLLASASRDKSIRIWNLQTMQCVQTLELVHTNWIRSIRVIEVADHLGGSQHIPYLVTASDDKTIKVTDLRTGRCVKTLQQHTHFVQCLDVYKNSLVSGSVDQTVKLWH